MSERLIIVGSGPAGYTAAIYAARARLEPLVYEGTVFGGALMTTTDVENFPGFAGGITGPELIEQMRKQALRFGARLLPEDVTGFEFGAGRPAVRTSAGEHRADAVILAMGAATRYLDVPGEHRLLGKGVSSCATCDGYFFKDADIAVVGGGDSAMEEAIFLTRYARSVTVIHRRSEFRASRIMLERARANEKIRWRTDTVVDEVLGDGSVDGLRLRGPDGKSTLDVTGLFVAIGHIPRSQLVAGQLELDADGYVAVRSPSTATTVPGVFAAGDLVDRHYRQAITAAASGCAAAIDAERWLSALG